MPFPTLSRIGLAGLALAATPALAADFDGPYGPPRGPVPGYEAPPHRHRFTGEGFGPRHGPEGFDGPPPARPWDGPRW